MVNLPSGIGDLGRLRLSCLGPFGLLATKNFGIIWISNLLTMSIPEEGYSRNMSYAINQMPTFYFKGCHYFR